MEQAADTGGYQSQQDYLRARRWNEFKQSDLGQLVHLALEEVLKSTATALRSEYMKRLSANRAEFEAIVRPLQEKAYELLGGIHNEPLNYSLRDELAEVDLQIIKSYIPGYDQSIGWDRLPVEVMLQFNQLRRLMAESLAYGYATDSRDAREIATYSQEMVTLVHQKSDMVAELLGLLALREDDGDVDDSNDEHIRFLYNQVLLGRIFTPRDLVEVTMKMDFIHARNDTDNEIRETISKLCDLNLNEEARISQLVYDDILSLRRMVASTEDRNRRAARSNSHHIDTSVKNQVDHEIIFRMNSFFMNFDALFPPFQEQIYRMISPHMFRHPVNSLNTVQDAMYEAAEIARRSGVNVNSPAQSFQTFESDAASCNNDAGSDKFIPTVFDERHHRVIQSLERDDDRLAMSPGASPTFGETPSPEQIRQVERRGSHDTLVDEQENASVRNTSLGQPQQLYPATRAFYSPDGREINPFLREIKVVGFDAKTFEEETLAEYHASLKRPSIATTASSSGSGTTITPKTTQTTNPFDFETPKGPQYPRPTISNKRNASDSSIPDGQSPSKKTRMMGTPITGKRKPSSRVPEGKEPAKRQLNNDAMDRLVNDAYGLTAHGSKPGDL